MPLIKLAKTNQSAQDMGALLVNTDQILAVVRATNVTEIQTADGRSHWVRETPEQVLALVNAPLVGGFAQKA